MEGGLLAAGSKTKKKFRNYMLHCEFILPDSPTGGGQAETAEPGSIQLQGHGNPVFYRNVWIAEK